MSLALKIFNDFRLISGFFEEEYREELDAEILEMISDEELSLIKDFYEDKISNNYIVRLLQVMDKFEYFDFENTAYTLIFKFEIEEREFQNFHFFQFSDGLFKINYDEGMIFAFKKNLTSLCKILANRNLFIAKRNYRSLLKFAYMNSNADLILFLHNLKIGNLNNEFFHLADLETLKFLDKNGIEIPNSTTYFNNIVREGNLDVGKWYQEKYNIQDFGEGLKIALTYGKLDFLEWFHEMGLNVINSGNFLFVLNIAANYSHLFKGVDHSIVLKWFLEKGFQILQHIESILSYVSLINHFELLRFLDNILSFDISCKNRIIYNACKSGNLEIAQYFSKNKIKADRYYLFYRILESNNLEILKWFLSIVDKKKLDRFKKKLPYISNLGMIKYLHQEFNFSLSGLENHILNLYYKDDDLESMQWLYENIKMKKVQNKMNNACKNNALKIAKWLGSFENCTISSEIFQETCSKGFLEMSQWIYNFRKSQDFSWNDGQKLFTDLLLRKMATHFEIIKWASTIVLFTDDERNIIFSQAIRNCNFKVAKFIGFSTNFRISEDFNIICLHGELEFAKWMVRNNKNSTFRLTMPNLNNIRTDNPQMYEWIVENRLY